MLGDLGRGSGIEAWFWIGCCQEMKQAQWNDWYLNHIYRVGGIKQG